MRTALALLAIAAMLLAGCTADPGEGSANVGDGRVYIVGQDVAAYGRCTFAVYDGYYSGGLVLIGCDGGAV